MRENLVSLIRESAKSYPDARFLCGESGEYSYSEAESLISRFATRLEAFGVSPGDRVIILLPNCPESILLLFATVALGAVAVLLHEGSSEATLRHVASETEPKIVISGQIEPEKQRCFSSKLVNLESMTASLLRETCNAVSEFKPVVPSPRQPALILYTSGSTGVPRGVTLSHGNILFVVDKIQRRLAYRPTDRIGLFLPLSFDYGLYQAFLCALSGACLVIRDSSFAGPLLPRLIVELNISVLPGTPNLYESLLKIASRRNLVFPSIRVATNTGAHLPRNCLGELARVMPEASIYPMYGLTECKRVSILLPGEIASRPGSVGRVLDQTEARVVNDEGTEVPPGEVGELVVSGDHVALGYWNAPEETANRFRLDPRSGKVLLYTGDKFFMDSDGYLYYVGREDDQIKRRGFRINKLEIERAAQSVEGVLNASVVMLQERLILFIGVSADGPTRQALMVELGRRLESYKVPDAIEILDQFPTTRNGKVDYRALEAMV